MRAAEQHGVARVTTLAAPPSLPRQSGLQGTLALDLTGHRETTPPRTPGASACSPADLEAFTSRFGQAVVEVLSGDRGPAQLLHWVTAPVYEGLVNRSRALARAGGTDQRLRRARARLRSIHVSSPGPGVAEFSLHVRHGHRSRAVAGRLEVRHGAWTCVALQFG